MNREELEKELFKFIEYYSKHLLDCLVLIDEIIKNKAYTIISEDEEEFEDEQDVKSALLYYLDCCRYRYRDPNVFDFIDYVNTEKSNEIALTKEARKIASTIVMPIIEA